MGGYGSVMTNLQNIVDNINEAIAEIFTGDTNRGSEDVDSLDSKHQDAGENAKKAVAAMKDGDVVLFRFNV